MKLSGRILVFCFPVLLLLSRCTEFSDTSEEKPEGSDLLKLEVLATTMTQIVVQWRNEPEDASSLELERSTDPSFAENLKSYSVDKGTFLLADTDREPVSRTRFIGDKRGPLLDPETDYYYRVRADIEGGGSRYSNTVSARVSGPVRGKEGDLWADVVLGVSGFGDNVAYQPTKYGTYHPGGVLIDKTVEPNRMYIADCNNNRILGFKSTLPKDGAEIVLGQPDFNSCGGNGDSSAQLFPYRGPAGATTLCFTYPAQISMGETIVRVSMTVDDKGNLYVPDIFNNRILKYNDPFGTDAKADQVWGQADFSANEPNRGLARPGSNTLHLEHRGAVTLDSDGNLWVADTGNNRVLRFPRNPETGIIEKDADVVLGQKDSSTNTFSGRTRTLAELVYPRDVEFDSRGGCMSAMAKATTLTCASLFLSRRSRQECRRPGSWMFRWISISTQTPPVRQAT